MRAKKLAQRLFDLAMGHNGSGGRSSIGDNGGPREGGDGGCGDGGMEGFEEEEGEGDGSTITITTRAVADDEDDVGGGGVGSTTTFTHSLMLSSAYEGSSSSGEGMVADTNITPGFCGAIDHIFYDRMRWKVTRRLPLPTSHDPRQGYLPSEVGGWLAYSCDLRQARERERADYSY